MSSTKNKRSLYMWTEQEDIALTKLTASSEAVGTTPDYEKIAKALNRRFSTQRSPKAVREHHLRLFYRRATTALFTDEDATTTSEDALRGLVAAVRLYDIEARDVATPSLEWTAEESSLTQQLRREGLSYQHISERMGIWGYERTLKEVKDHLKLIVAAPPSETVHASALPIQYRRPEWEAGRLVKICESDANLLARAARLTGCSVSEMVRHVVDVSVDLSQMPGVVR